MRRKFKAKTGVGGVMAFVGGLAEVRLTFFKVFFTKMKLDLPETEVLDRFQP